MKSALRNYSKLFQDKEWAFCSLKLNLLLTTTVALHLVEEVQPLILLGGRLSQQGLE